MSFKNNKTFEKGRNKIVLFSWALLYKDCPSIQLRGPSMYTVKGIAVSGPQTRIKLKILV